MSKSLEDYTNKFFEHFLKRMKKVIRNSIIYPLICCLLTLGSGCSAPSSGGRGWSSGGGGGWGGTTSNDYDYISSSEFGYTDDSPGIQGGVVYPRRDGYMTTSEIDDYGNISSDGAYSGSISNSGVWVNNYGEEYGGNNYYVPAGRFSPPVMPSFSTSTPASNTSNFRNPEIISDLITSYFFMADWYEKQNQYDKAKEKYEKILKVDKSNALAHYALGNIYNKKSMKKEAEKSWKRAIEIKPDFADAHHNLAVYYYEQKEYTAAYNEWNFVKRINPEYPNVDKNLGLVKNLLFPNSRRGIGSRYRTSSSWSRGNSSVSGD